MKKVAILIFDKVEVLDFAGPFEVFSVSYDEAGNKLYDVCLIAENSEVVKASQGFSGRWKVHGSPTKNVIR